MLGVQNLSYLSNTVLSGYSQINQMKYLLAMGKGNAASAVSSVKSVQPNTSSLSAENADFIKQYQDKMTKMMDAANGVLDPKTSKLAAAAQDSSVAWVSGELEKAGDTYQLTVQQTASGQIDRSAEISSNGELPAMGGALNIRTSKGNFNINFTSAGAKTNKEALGKLASKINATGSGVTASVKEKDGKSYLELEGEGSGSFVASGSLADSLGLTTVSSGREAIFTISKNGEAAETHTSTTNHVEVDGMSIQFRETGVTEIKAGRGSSSASADAMEKLIKSFNDTLSFLDSNSGKGVGVLQQMKKMILPPASERSMEMIGISANKDGSLSFDRDKFMKAMDTSPSFMKSIAESVAKGIKSDAQSGMNVSSASLLSNTSNGGGVSGLGIGNSSSLNRTNLDGMNLMNMYNRTGVYNLSNYYTVGIMMNMFV